MKGYGILNIFEPFRKIYRWFDKGSLVETLAGTFTLVTIINSFMMVVGWDQPKEGFIAYVHLLSRLAIVVAIITVLRYEDVLDSLKAWLNRERNLSGSRKGKPRFTRWIVRRVTASRNSFSSASLCFTIIVILLSVGSIVFQEWIEPAGGKELYRNLLFLFLALYIGFSIVFLYGSPPPGRTRKNERDIPEGHDNDHRT